jgi:hypothetical protein
LPGGGGGEEVAHLGEELLRACRSRVEGGGERRQVGRREELGTGLGPRAERRSLGEVVAAPDEDACAIPFGLLA